MIGIFSHDAGGANLLANYVKNNNDDYVFCLKGPATNIFKEQGLVFKNEKLKSAIAISNSVICSTGYQSNHEYNAIKHAKSLKKKCVVIFDHWTNFSSRLVRNSNAVIPDEIWVVDSYAEMIARQLFPSILIIIKKNDYFENIKNSYDLLKKVMSKKGLNRGLSVLFVAEPRACIVPSEPWKSNGIDI